MQSSLRYDVTSVKDGKAGYTITTIDSNGTEMAMGEQTMKLPADGPKPMPYDGEVEDSVTTPAGTFRCIRTEHDKTGMVTWMHHGVVVKMTMEDENMTMTQELIELKME